MPSEYPRGSEWRKWDLHVHTPLSALNNGFGTDFERYAKALFERAVTKEIAVIGVTDYFSIQGYKQLRALIRDDARLRALLGSNLAARASRILLLPNVEFRTSLIVARPGGNDSRVDFHVIFSDELEPELIEEHFLRGLEFTAESSPGSPDERWPVTLANLRALGKTLKAQHKEFKKKDDLYVGMMTAVVAHEDVTKVLSSQPSRFRDRFLLVVPADEDLSEFSWDGQAHLARKLLIQKSHMLFSSNPGTREFGLGRKHATVEEFLREFGHYKPCIHGSDSHTYDALFEPDQKRYLWVKADPTFQGLRQLLYEPESRVYIGDEPPFLAQVREKGTKYMTELRFSRTESAREGENWFSDGVPLNQGLIAIIGNKGSGKSALADILALLGDTAAAAHFSFLNEARFLAPKTGFGNMFQAEVTWRSGRLVGRRLGDPVDATAPELVKYIPQNYLEAICTELKESSDTGFDRELMDVIFSHVSQADRLGTETLPLLIEFLTSERQARIALLTKDLADINDGIVALEDQLTEEHKKSIEGQLTQRRAELEVHDKAQPVEVKEPDQDPDAQDAAKAVADQLAALETKGAELDAAIASEQDQLARSALQIAAADRLLARIDNLERQLISFYNESVQDTEVLGLDLKQLVVLQADRQPIADAKKRAEERSQAAKNALSVDVEGSLAARRPLILTEVDAKRLQLDEPARRYQEYRHELAEWQAKRAEIDGSSEKPFSVKGLEARLAALSDLPTRLAERRQVRINLVREIFETKRQLLADYQRLYSPVQEFIDEHPVSKRHHALQFSASMAVDGFVDGLLEMIHQGRKGSFQGEEEGRDRLRQLVLSADFSSTVGLEAFLASVQEHLDRDKGDPEEKPVRLSEQLRQGVSPQDLYDLLYGLVYLKPRFELRWQGKPLDQLSPGERGNLLLVFYLLIDKRDVPLIIDQPEENLDNQTVATTLVPAIEYAKQRRQIIIVTHNPNLAVVCDADQVIHTHIDKTDGNRMIYAAGAIEQPTITQLIVDVLEGTKPAFDLRDARYEVLERLS